MWREERGAREGGTRCYRGGGGVLEGEEVLATSCHYTHQARCHSCLGQQSVKLSKSGNCSLASPDGWVVALFLSFRFHGFV